jgi:type IX secretion system substrate protein/SprB-like repeat protein/galactose oxidase-like protein
MYYTPRIHHLYLLIVILISVSTASYSQGVWSPIANYGGGAVTEERAFGIGNFGYVGTTAAGFWEYDPVTDSWSQKAAFIGPARLSAVGFSIGTKGYFGTGGNNNDFYEYDQATNTWTQKTNFGGVGREGAVGCSIDGKGYVGTGGSYFNDWWEYDPVADTWTQKANLTGPSRYHGGSFAISSKGYICTGFNGNFYNDLWEYDPLTNAWTAKAALPGITRDRPVAVAVNGKGYLVTGWSGSTALNDAWEYDPIADMWTQLPNFPGAARYNACGFAAGNNIYVGTGIGGGNTSDFYEYGPACSVQTTTQTTSCAGICDGSASVSGLTPPGTTFLWSNGSTTQGISSLCAGTYTVTVTDSAGCVSVNQIPVLQPDSINPNASLLMPSCFGNNDGSICSMPTGGVPPYTSYLWSTGDTTSCISNLSAGTFTLTVTDSAGCSNTEALVLNQPSQILLAITHSDASCSTCADGSASVGVGGGTPPFSYSWSNGGSQVFQTNLLPGIYAVCVTDSNNCSQCDSVEVSFAAGVSEISGFNEAFMVAPNPFQDIITLTVENSQITVKSVRLMDVSGREVHVNVVYQGDQVIINTDKLSRGFYSLLINSATTSWTTKLLKQ